jgi:hypothetical protein
MNKFLTITFLVALFAFAQYIANQPSLTSFEKAIFPKQLTEK